MAMEIKIPKKIDMFLSMLFDSEKGFIRGARGYLL